MKNWTLRAQFAVLLFVFPLFAHAQSATISFGTQTGSSIQCTSSFSPYWGSDTVYLTGTTTTDSTGSPSTVFTPYVNTYSLTYGTTPNICVNFKATYPGTYSAWVDATYGYGAYTATVYVTGTYAPPFGWINPKYIILGVMYAPPGGSSSVTYQSDTVVGNSTSVLSSFSNSYAKSTSLSTGNSIFGVSLGSTTSSSSQYTQSLDISSSIAVTQSTSLSRTLRGFSDPSRGVNRDYDYIFVWLNPMLKFTAGESYISWDGYGYDTADMPEMDVVGIQLGCLNGDFQNTSNWTACNNVLSGAFQRPWAQTNVDGSSPALTGTVPCVPGSGTDLCNVMAADPFSDPAYSISWPASGTHTTPDGRFTICHDTAPCAQTIDYQPNLITSYTQRYSVTASQSQTATRQYQQTYAMSSQSSTSAFGTNFSRAMNSSSTLTWRDQFSSATSRQTTDSASFSIVGPDASYAGPIQFVVYQDNLYGTFVFQSP